jgi:acid phosphatase class B
MTNRASLALLVLLGACAAETIDDSPSIDDFDAGKTDDAARARSISCHTTDAAADLVKVRFTPNAGAFDIEASSAKGAVFALASQRPSLNAAIEDGTSDVPNEFVDFRPSGLDVVPPIGTPHFELTLATGPKALTYGDASTQVQLTCQVSASKLLSYLGIAPVNDLDVGWAMSVGFDIDDTLLFSTPTFTRAFATGGTPAPGDAVFWTQANRCDPGCEAETLTLPDGTTKQLPASQPSGVKARIREQVAFHQACGAEVYAITARPDIAGDSLRAYIEQELGIPSDHVFFEPDLDQPGNPAGKTDRMAELGLDVFYGDSDSDITDSAKVQGAHVRGIRVLRSPKSSNRSNGRLAKYHPGYYGEPILAGSYD